MDLGIGYGTFFKIEEDIIGAKKKKKEYNDLNKYNRDILEKLNCLLK